MKIEPYMLEPAFHKEEMEYDRQKKEWVGIGTGLTKLEWMAGTIASSIAKTAVPMSDGPEDWLRNVPILSVDLAISVLKACHEAEGGAE